MINAQDATELANRLYEQAANQLGSRLSIIVDPRRMTASKRTGSTSAIPMLTGHGEAQKLAELIHSFHQWGSPISIGLIRAEGIFQFWVEPDEPA